MKEQPEKEILRPANFAIGARTGTWTMATYVCLFCFDSDVASSYSWRIMCVKNRVAWKPIYSYIHPTECVVKTGSCSTIRVEVDSICYCYHLSLWFDLQVGRLQWSPPGGGPLTFT